MNDDDNQYKIENFRKKDIDDDSQYHISNFIKRPKSIEDPETSIGEDVKQSLLNTPHALKQMLSNLPHEINEAAHMPLGHSLKNIGQGVENLVTSPIDLGSQLVNYLAKKHVPYSEKLKEIYPNIPKHDTFGLGKQQPGDTLFQSLIPFGAIGKITKSLQGIKGTFARSGLGSAYSAAQGENPIESFLTGSALEGITHGMNQIPRRTKNLGERLSAGAANTILNKARKGIESGESFTPEQANKNALQQYTNIEGQPMGVDFGTLIGNKNLVDLYNVTSKIPFTGGRQQLAKVDKQLFDKKEELAKIAHEKERGELSTKKQDYEIQLKNSIEQLQKNRDILENQLPTLEAEINTKSNVHNQQKEAINAAPEHLTNLRHPITPHNELLKNEIESSFNNAQEATNKAYEPFNNLDVDLNSMRMPDTFVSKYKTAFDELKKQSEDLKELFSDDKDLGSDISKEINKAESFFTEKKPEDTSNLKTKRIGNKPLFNLKTATPEAITTHIRALQSLAEEAYASGKHRQAAQLNKMASGLKNDMKDILKENGYHDAVSALEQGDELFKKNVLPFYKNREIKKLASDRTHHLTDTSRVSLSNALHQPNMENILNKLSPSAKNASIYELITRGKYGREGHGLTPEEISKSFKTHLKSNTRESIANTNPQMSHYLENLDSMINENKKLNVELEDLTKNKERLTKETNKSTIKEESNQEKSQKELDDTARMEKESNERFQKLMNERFGIPKSKSTGVWKDIKKLFNPLNAASLGAAAFTFHALSPTKMAEALGITIPLAKKLNKMLTDPKLLKHYYEGTKVKPNIKKSGTLEQKINKGRAISQGLSGNDKEQKPLEIEVIGKRK